jgi:hypothetical protein
VRRKPNRDEISSYAPSLFVPMQLQTGQWQVENLPFEIYQTVSAPPAEQLDEVDRADQVAHFVSVVSSGRILPFQIS